MNLEEFKRVISEVTSDMFLAIIILLHNQLPCTENFKRYQKNFEKFMTPEDGSKTTTEGKTKTIASPRMMQNLSPIASLAERHGVNF